MTTIYLLSVRGILTFPSMLAVILIAASLAAQAWVFRNSPGRPADPCARIADHCPEESLDSILARQSEQLARQRALASGKPYPTAASVAKGLTPAQAAPKDSLRAEAFRQPDSED